MERLRHIPVDYHAKSQMPSGWKARKLIIGGKMQKENKVVYRISLKELKEKLDIKENVVDFRTKPHAENGKLDLEKSSLVIVAVNEL